MPGPGRFQARPAPASTPAPCLVPPVVAPDFETRHTPESSGTSNVRCAPVSPVLLALEPRRQRGSTPSAPEEATELVRQGTNPGAIWQSAALAHPEPSWLAA